MNPRFSIRDLGWLTIVAAILLRWYLDDPRPVPPNRITVATLQAPHDQPISINSNERFVVLIQDQSK